MSLCGGVVWGLHSHFHVQLDYSVEVVLRCVVVGVVTICFEIKQVESDQYKVQDFAKLLM